MSLSTSLRFELITNKKSLDNALARQKCRIEKCAVDPETDELYASRENQAKLEAAIALRSEWNESLAKVAEKKKFVNDAKSKKEELKCAWKTSIMIRRAALQQLFQAEFSQYEQELVAQSKAFFVQRT